MAQQWFLRDEDIKVDQDEIQGDILIGLQKRAEVFAFFSIVNPTGFKAALQNLAQSISFLRETRLYEETKGGSGRLVKRNVGFTFEGLSKLGALAGGEAGLDPLFEAGAEDAAHEIGDRPADWNAHFRGKAVDGVIIVAAWDPDMDTASTKANADADAAIAMFGGSVAALPRDEGRVRMTADGRAGHEHFGFADGVSQPGIAGLTLPVAEGGGQSFPGQDLLAANRFVLDASAPAAWMQNGSYMVFRRLNQDVPRFKDYTRDNWTRHSASEERFAASIVGRWADGSALARNARAPEPTEDEEHPEKNNAFEFGKDDPKQLVCPFAAHVRRVYPRQDLLNDSSEDHRIIRAGIAFGADDADDKGLLFVCYQSSIEQQFAFIQKSWANSATFPFTPGAPIEPALEGPPEPGIDLLIGQTLAPRSAFWATGELRDVPTFVHATGAAYLFSPSKSGLEHLAGV